MHDDFANAAGPWFWRMDNGAPLIGVAIDQKHVSIRGVCHGGVIMTLADLQSLPGSYIAGLRDRLVPTVGFTIDFITPAALGDWLEMKVDLLKRTRKTLFTQAIIRSQTGDVVARSSATFRILSEPHPTGRIVDILFDPDRAP